MSEGKPARGRPWLWRWGLVVACSAGAGFGAAVLSGMPTSFSQPLATLLAGAGALSAGALAYLNGQRTRELDEKHHQDEMNRERERHQDDTHRVREAALRDRYAAVSAQMADDSAAIRQAGVYALTALADDWHAFGEDDERQVCINLLQWYLRVPFPVANDPDKPDLSEREIRQTIVTILSQRHRRPTDDPKSWASTAISLDQVSLPACALGSLNLTGFRLGEADLNYADLRAANLRDADLIGANLSGANLRDAQLGGADLIGANLHGAQLRGADLHGANLSSANLSGANLSLASLSGATLGNAHLGGANLIGANLRGANLRGAHLHGADLGGANLRGADLRGADLRDANLEDAILYKPDLSNVDHNEQTKWPSRFAPPVGGDRVRKTSE
ncbi:pentapeptide repeat-containing protein [Nocardia sp. NPDC003482]